MEKFLFVMSALADRTRLRLLLSLKDRELCACQLVEFIGLADSTVSKHMSILKAAGLVDARKTGRWVHYRLAENCEGSLQKEVIELVLRQLSRDPELLEDTARVRELVMQSGADACSEDSELCSIEAVLNNRK